MSSLPETKYSLLLRLQDASNDEAWMQFVELYEKAVFRYVRSQGLQEADALEVVQQVLLAVHRSIDRWQPQGQGSFRRWLLRVASNQATTVVRQKYRQRMLTGGTTANNALQAAADPACQDADNQYNREWRQWAFCWASSQVEREVSETSWQAFWLTAVENRPPADVAKQIGLSVGAIYAAKCRVLKRLREAVSEIDENNTSPQNINSNEVQK